MKEVESSEGVMSQRCREVLSSRGVLELRARW